MKLAFKGFRGFGQKSDFFDFKSLTILTGKNGSGKSTLLKLLELISINFAKLNSFQSLFETRIDIGNDLFGGRSNVLHDLNKSPKLIFETRFEFYTDIYEIHVNFEVEEYELKIKSIDILDQRLKKTICTYESGLVQINCRYFHEKYKEKAYQYNLIEEYAFYHDSYYSNKDYKFQYYNPELNESLINSLMKNHISMRDDSYIGMQTTKEEYSHHFKELVYPDGNGSYIILDIPEENWKLSKSQIKRIIEDSEHFDLALEIQKEIRLNYNPNFDIYKFAYDLYVCEVENFVLGIPEFKIDGFGTFFKKMDSEPHKKVFKDHGIETEDYLNLSFSAKNSFLIDILFSKIHIFYHLAKDSSGIFEKRILDLFKSINNLSKQSSVVNIASRSYNIYDKNNSFSVFLKGYINETDEVKELIVSYIKHNIKKLQIADDIEILNEGNTGFIYLVKGGKKISLMDEGSGINNLLSILLFFSLKMNFQPNGKINFKDKKKEIIILEEPETNLHPNLQSKLADVISDFTAITNFTVIVETHSEYLIRKLQYLVAKKMIQSDSVIIYYFNFKNEKGIPKIEAYPININQNGTLDKEFGTGFFDEADNIAIDLFTLKKSQEN